MRIARVFPRRTKASPTDDLAFFGPPGLFPPEVDGVHVSVTFTYDLPRAEELAEAWESVAPVSLGGPALGEPEGDFIPGLYLRHGYTITSRGCPNRCWFCHVWRRQPTVLELPIVDGHNILDDNLLACSDDHIRQVFAMCRRQKMPIRFTGGFEAKRLQRWHLEELKTLRLGEVFFAFDDFDDREQIKRIVPMVHAAGIPYWQLRCYVLIGYLGDTFAHAEERLNYLLSFGFMPMAMLWHDQDGHASAEWRRFQRLWARPIILGARCRDAKEKS
jgi:hypothetical protein